MEIRLVLNNVKNVFIHFPSQKSHRLQERRTFRDFVQALFLKNL